MIRQILGGLIIGSLFAAPTIFGIKELGWKKMALGWGITLVVIALIWLGIWLIFGAV